MRRRREGLLQPALRNANAELVTASIAECHRQAGDRYIIGAGCEVPRDTPLENVRAMTEYANSGR
jgi:uroporphyrinogen-III decarboxylase